MPERNGGQEEHRCGFAAIIGLPNAGKSTLINRYLEEKVTIVTPKPQTTRNNVTCILSAPSYQIIFIDTPGILTPRYRMQEVMASFVTSAVEEADIVLVLIDASRATRGLPESILRRADWLRKKPLIVALNKVDLMKKPLLLPLIKETSTVFPQSHIVPISALEGGNTGDLFDTLLSHLPVGPKLYPEDMVSDQPERFFVAELIRESVFLTMEREIPYATAVVIEQYEEKERVVVINAAILVEKKSQKPIIIGRNGATIKAIGTKARLGIEEFLGRKVYLELFVKVRKDWRKKETFLREAGLIRR